MRNKNFRSICIVATSLWLTWAFGIAHAADDAAADDPPDRVARLAYLQGAVSMQPAGTDDWADASLNRPLTTGDKLWVDRGSRAELQAGSANVHIDQGTGFSFLELSDNVLQMRVTDGAINVKIQRLRDDEVIEVDTPSTAVTITQPGEYHIEVVDDGARTVVKNYSGECEVADYHGTTRLHSRQQASVSGDDKDDAVARLESFAPRSDFDAWSNDRNQHYERSASARYVAPDVIGYADLDDQGDWNNESDYGYVWYPTHVVSGWSPYRFGHWTWVAPWGWTWVDDAAWGFAPFHYGRWAYVRNRWGWVPGPVGVRAVYAPALVAWVGNPGANVSISVGGGIGWFPLAPREVYVPGYRCSERHMYGVNYANTVIVNRTVINNVYMNRTAHIDYRYQANPRAVTVVQRETFVGARAVGNHMVSVKERDLRGWRTANATPAIAPDRASTLGPRWDANAARNVNHGREREVVVNHAPPARASFVREQQAIRANNNQPVSNRTLIRNENPQRNDVRPLEAGSRNVRNAAPNVSAPAAAVVQPSSPRTLDIEQRRRFDRPPARDNNNGGTQPNIGNEPRQSARDQSVREERLRNPRGADRPLNAPTPNPVIPPQPTAPVQTQSPPAAGDQELRVRGNGERRFDRGPQYRVDPRPEIRQQQPAAPEARIENRRPEVINREAPNRPAPIIRAPDRPREKPVERPIERPAERPAAAQPAMERHIERPTPPVQPPPQAQPQPRPEPKAEHGDDDRGRGPRAARHGEL